MTTRDATPIDCGRRLGVLTVGQLNAALERFGFGPLTRAEAIPHGLFGQNVRLHTARGAWVLRGCPHTPDQLAGEAFFAGAAHPFAPVPWPYLRCDDAALLGWPFALMPCLPGQQLHQEIGLDSLAAEDRIDLARALGEALADLHRTPLPAWGAYDLARDGIERIPGAPSAWLRGRMQRDIDWTRGAPGDRLPADDLAWLDEKWREWSPALDHPCAPTVVHHDFRAGNSLGERDRGGRWRVTGIVDLQECYAGDGEADLVRQACDFWQSDPAAAHRFVAAYWSKHPPRPGYRERFLAYLVFDRMVIWAYGCNHGWFKGAPDMTFRGWVEPMLARDWWPQPTFRVACEADIPELERLIPASARALQTPYYSGAQIEAALGPVFGVDRQLIRDGTYFVAVDGGRIVGCGGWSKRKSRYGGDGGRAGEDPLRDPRIDPAMIRAFFVHPDFARRGIGRAFLEMCETAILRGGFGSAEIIATLAGEPLYSAGGYRTREYFEIALRGGLAMRVARMDKILTSKE